MTDKRMKTEPEEEGHLSGVSLIIGDGFSPSEHGSDVPLSVRRMFDVTQVYLGRQFSQRLQKCVWMDIWKTGTECVFILGLCYFFFIEIKL